jgi:hypothetical protein
MTVHVIDARDLQIQNSASVTTKTILKIER